MNRSAGLLRCDLLLALLILSGCNVEGGHNSDVDTETATSSDGDADTDSDSDADTDSDADADTDSDAGTDSDTEANTETSTDEDTLSTDSGTGTDSDTLTDIANPPPPYGDILTDAQLRWLSKEMILFAHFGIKTYYVNDNHMGEGNEDPQRFNPVDFDASQWIEACVAGGFGGIVLTAKHHDGFCNWPTETTAHNVSASPWKNGNGDVVHDVVTAFRNANMWVGLYLSAYDLHYLNSGANPDAYNDYFLTQLTELCTNYGTIDELWFDGFGADNMTVDAEMRDDVVRALQPDAVTFEGTVNPVRWTGNEVCDVSEPNWLGTAPFEADCIAQGNWFWNDTPICSLERLQEIYRSSTARGAVALINVSPNPNGKIDTASMERLKQFGDWVRHFNANDVARGKTATADNIRDNNPQFSPEMALDGNSNTYWATDDDVLEGGIEVDLENEQTIEAVVIQEYLPLGQRVSEHTVSIWQNNAWREVASATTIGHKRVLEFTPVKTTRVRLSFTAEAPIVISNLFITAR